MKFDSALIQQVHAALARFTKEAFTPPPAAGGTPAAPAPAGAVPPPAAPAMPMAGAPAGAPPMDPSMMGGMPMDPSMMGGMPMDPSMAGAPPMDPSMMGGMPPTGGTPITVTLEDLVALFEQVAGSVQPSKGKGEAPNEPSPNISKALDKINQRLDSIESQLGQAMPPGVPAGEAGAIPEMPPIGAGAMPFTPAEPMPPMPAPMIASASDVLGQVKSAKKIGDIIANLRKR